MSLTQTVSQEISIYIHSSLVKPPVLEIRAELARLSHYFRFHYQCRVMIWNPKNEPLMRWHPSVPSPIFYPEIDVVGKIETEGPNLILAAVEEQAQVQGWLDAHAETGVFTVPADPQEIARVPKTIEGAIESVLAAYKKSIPPGQLFYDICTDKGSWEETFWARTELPPLQAKGFEKHGPFGYFRELEYAWGLGHMDQTPGSRVLDVGSYTTWVPTYLTEKGFDVISLDLDPEAVAYQRKEAAKLAKPFEVIHADATKIPLPNESVDQILAISTVEHFPKNADSVALRDFHRVLRPGGLAILTVPYDHFWAHEDTGLRPGGGLQRYYTMQTTISRLVQSPLFEIVSLEFLGGKLLEVGKYDSKFINPTASQVLCISLRKPEKSND